MVLVGSNRIELDRIRTQLFNMRPKDVPVYQPEIIAMDSNGPEFAVQDKVAEIIELCGQVDILINNSTIYTRADALSVKIETDICVMNINYFAPIAFTKGKNVPHNHLFMHSNESEYLYVKKRENIYVKKNVLRHLWEIYINQNSHDPHYMEYTYI